MKQNKEALKKFFETGDKPTQQQYADLIDSYIDAKQVEGEANRRFVIDATGEVSVALEQKNPEYTLSPISGTHKVNLLKDGASVSQIDLTRYVDDTNLARLVRGEVQGNNLIVTRDDNSTFSIDVSSLIGSTGTNKPVVETTYSDLLNLISASRLVPNQEYSFDFKNIYKQIDTDIVKQDAPVEKLVVKAETNNTLFSTARSLTYKNDEIEYNVSTVMFDGLNEAKESVTNVANQGTILKRIDKELEIETPYDFRTEKFVRYKGIVPNYDPATSYQKYNIVKDPDDSTSYIRVCYKNDSSSIGNNIDNLTYWNRQPFGGFIVTGFFEGYTFTKTKPFMNVGIDTNDYQEFLTFANTATPTKDQAYKVKLHNKNIVVKTKAFDCEIKYFESIYTDGVTILTCEEVKLIVGKTTYGTAARGCVLLGTIKGMKNKVVNINGNTVVLNLKDNEIIDGKTPLSSNIDGAHSLEITYGYYDSISNSIFENVGRIVGSIVRRTLSGRFGGSVEFCSFINNATGLECKQTISRIISYFDMQKITFSGKVQYLTLGFDQNNYVPVNNERYNNLATMRNCTFNCNINKFNILYNKQSTQDKISLWDAIFNTKELTGKLSIPSSVAPTSNKYNYNFNFTNYYKHADDSVDLYYQDINASGVATMVKFVPQLV